MSIDTEISKTINSKHFDFFNANPLRDFCDNSPVALFTTDHAGRINYYEGKIFEVHGLCNESAPGHSLFCEQSLFAPLGKQINATLAGRPSSGQLELDDSIISVWLSPVVDDDDIVGISGLCIECTEEAKHKRLMQQFHGHYELLAQYSTDIITKYTPDGFCCYASPSVKKVLGYNPCELLNKSLFEYFHPDDVKSRRKFYTKLIEQPSNESVCYRIRHADDKYIWLETQNTAIRDPETNEVVEIVSVSRDITERKETEERLLYLANFDSLTGLPNRALFRDRLRRAVARAQRNDSKLALFFIDLDRFKTINDSLGHHAGDQLLRSVAKRLKQFAREGDTIARLGGDEFTVILEGIQDSEDAATVAEKIIELMRPPFRLDGHQLVVSPSIGITIFPDDADDMRSLLKNADTAMYRSKENSGNCFEFYTSDMNEKAYEALVLENNLRSALDKNQFRLHYQPQIDLHSKSIIGIEALMRWEHPEQGLLNPEEFIPFIEETGLIEPIGEWVLKEACKEAKLWQEKGLPPVRVAVNLSMRQFVANDLVQKVASALEEAELDPKYLELEITESFLAQNVDQATEILHELHELGVELSIDDFGTGYSSLAYLKQFPLNTLKIDQSFVSDITTNPEAAAIAEAIIALGQSLKLNVIAEGVENEEQTFFLRGHGCDWVQGYLFSKPLPSEKIIPWMKKNINKSLHFEQTSFWPEVVNS
ncbi:MAG: EAL domain-containing protein [Gammaproteobacteria bacterium]|nr:EAL domain-containing protein [Gammaproteobacteria bacterium]